MAFRVFSIPVQGCAASERVLNAFLHSHQVLHVDRRLSEFDGGARWTVCVDYVAAESASPASTAGARRGSRIDYREVMSAPDFRLYCRLREVRKEIADQEGIALFTIFTNEQLAQAAQSRPRSKAELGKIPGVGEGRLDKYAERVLVVIGEDASRGDGDAT